MPVSDQIVILLSLTSGLFDEIPIEKIQDAEAAVVENNKEITADVFKRLLSGEPLSDPDREAILKIAGNILAPFKVKPESAPKPDETKK